MTNSTLTMSLINAPTYPLTTNISSVKCSASTQHSSMVLLEYTPMSLYMSTLTPPLNPFILMHTPSLSLNSSFFVMNSIILSKSESSNLPVNPDLWNLPYPKKDGCIHWISDFCALNKALKHKVYPIPRIQDILSHHAGYGVLSKLDISMQYYTFQLDEPSHELCAIATPFGLYHFCHLPMGVCQSPDIAQEIM